MPQFSICIMYTSPPTNIEESRDLDRLDPVSSDDSFVSRHTASIPTKSLCFVSCGSFKICGFWSIESSLRFDYLIWISSTNWVRVKHRTCMNAFISTRWSMTRPNLPPSTISISPNVSYSKNWDFVLRFRYIHHLDSYEITGQLTESGKLMAWSLFT